MGLLPSAASYRAKLLPDPLNSLHSLNGNTESTSPNFKNEILNNWIPLGSTSYAAPGVETAKIPLPLPPVFPAAPRVLLSNANDAHKPGLSRPGFHHHIDPSSPIRGVPWSRSASSKFTSLHIAATDSFALSLLSPFTRPPSGRCTPVFSGL